MNWDFNFMVIGACLFSAAVVVGLIGGIDMYRRKTPRRIMIGFACSIIAAIILSGSMTVRNYLELKDQGYFHD